jgi:N-acetylmuramate 1-kinase
MMNLNKEIIPEQLPELMYRTGLISKKVVDTFSQVVDIRQVHSDGSCRRFFRIGMNGKSLCLAVAPAAADGNDLLESRAAGSIGQHLLQRGVPVPEIYGWDQRSGLILFEDLGDMRLYDLVVRTSGVDLRMWYRQVIDQLAHMQLAGAKGFDTGWCWDTSRYDRALMVSRESRYFLRSFWQDMLGREVPDGITEEFQEMASQADGQYEEVFLHRDFQSRNIMIKDGLVRFIDYQGGRLGPPGYDLASLLIDPYAALSLDFQEELLLFYLDMPAIRRSVDRKNFRCQYAFLAVQRNLQIIGAFSFLSRVRKKVFFSEYIDPSLRMLQERLGQSSFASFPVLRRMVDTAVTTIGFS